MTYYAKAGIKVRKPATEVFEAVADPQKLSSYFVSTASGRIEPGAELTWSFAEFGVTFKVVVIEVVPNERIVIEWPASGTNNKFAMTFRALNEGNTFVEVIETGWDDAPANLEQSYGQTKGWMHMLCSLKAYLEYGINLREGGVSDK
eukprot:ANDGO_05742.mRNA.1 hypothetical protein